MEMVVFCFVSWIADSKILYMLYNAQAMQEWLHPVIACRFR